MGCSTRLGPCARTEDPKGVHRITKDTGILNAIQISHRLPFTSLPFPRREMNGKPCVFPPLLDMGISWFVKRERGRAR